MAIKDDISARLGGNLTSDDRREARLIRRAAFEVNLVQYPEDLGSSADLKHYVEFGITVRGKSKFNTTNRVSAAAPTVSTANLSKEEISKAAGVALVAGAAIIGFGVTSKIQALIGKTNKTPAATALEAAGRQVPAAVGGAAAAAAAAAALSFNDLLQPDTSYRISDSIALHLDGPPSVKYNVNYANADLGTLAGVMSGGLSASTNSPGASESAVAIGTSMAAIPAALGATNVKNLLSARTGTALNPFKEVIFESVDFRTFSFKYKFFPKSDTESRSIKEIIKLFKFHMHPEMSDGNLFFINPSEFNIAYHFEGGPNAYFHKFAPCVLTEMDVNYGGEQFSSFRDGTPTEIGLSLTFREKEILTKEMIEVGY